MKNIFWKFFNLTIGKLVRGVQMSITKPSEASLIYNEVLNMSILESAQYAKSHFKEVVYFYHKSQLHEYCINKFINSKISSLILEFGVFKGESVNFFAKKCPNAEIYGFDSFEGLEEDWFGYNLPAGHFSTNGKLPKVPKSVTLIKGWFKDTLPIFLTKIPERKIDILHLDADTYSPTAFVLNSILKHLKNGTCLIFDEYFGYPNWENHEFKAWQDFVLSNHIKYRYIACSGATVAIEIV